MFHTGSKIEYTNPPGGDAPGESEKDMTVKEYLKITQCKKLQFLTSPGKFEKINAVNEKWGNYYYPPDVSKWLDKEIIRAFVLSDGSVRFHTH